MAGIRLRASCNRKYKKLFYCLLSSKLSIFYLVLGGSCCLYLILGFRKPETGEFGGRIGLEFHLKTSVLIAETSTIA